MRRMEVKIQGTVCSKCKRLEQVAREAACDTCIETTFVKLTDVDSIMAYPIMSTPGLVINEESKSSGRLPRKQEIVA